MPIKDEIVILMTGTISPNTFATLKLKDPAIRKNQYIEAISFYIQHTDFKIVFAENSGQSLEKYFIDYQNRLEFLTYESPKTVIDKGKGFKEMEILQYAISNSNFIKGANAIIKITGRLILLNINKLTSKFLKLKRANKNIVSCSVYKLGKMDGRCFMFSENFWPYLEAKGQSIDIKYSIEKALWDAVVTYKSSSENVFKLTHSPLRIKGVNAGFGTSYDHSLSKMILKQIRHSLISPYYNHQLKK